MNNLSLNRSQVSQSAITEPAFLQDDHESEAIPLAAPKPFFGRHVTFQPAIDCHHSFLDSFQGAGELRVRSSLGLSHESNLPQRIRALEGRGSAYSILAKEAEAELLNDAGENVIQLEPAAELSSDQASTASSRESLSSERTLLPADLPAPFFGARTTTNFYNIQRKQRQQLKIAAAHQEKAKECLRECRKNMKLQALLKEHGDPQKAKIVGEIIDQLKNDADYHTVMAQEIQARVYAPDPQSPGAHQVIAQGNYELEFPVRPPSPTRRAREVKNPQEDLIRLPKTKAISLVSAKFLENKKLSSKEKQQLPVAKKIVAKEVAAESPKNIKLPEARAQFVN